MIAVNKGHRLAERWFFSAVSDRMVFPASDVKIAEWVDNTLSTNPNITEEWVRNALNSRMDAFVRRYIHEKLSYRFVILPDGKAARDLEAAIKDGKWEPGRPLLNPAKRQLRQITGREGNPRA